MKASVHLWQYLTEFLLDWEMIQTKVVEKIKTHILCLLFAKNCAVFETMWKIILEPERPQMTI